MASAGVQVNVQEPSGPWIEIRGLEVLLEDNRHPLNLKGALDVFVKDLKKKRKVSQIGSGSQDRLGSYGGWTLDEQCALFPKDNIKIIFFYSRRFPRCLKRGKIDEFKFDAGKVIEVCRQQSLAGDGQEFEYTESGDSSKLILKVKLWEDVSNHLSIDDINNLGKGIDQISDWSLSDGTKKALETVFSSIVDDGDFEVLDTAVTALKALAATHPIINIVFKAVMVPYEMWKQQREFDENVKALRTDMCTSLKSMVDAFLEMKLESAKDSVIKLLRVIIEAWEYVNEHLKKGRVASFISAQSSNKLNSYRSGLKDCRLDFREAAIVQVLVNSGVMSA